MRAQDNADAIVPVWKGEYEPLHAIYSKNCLGAIRCSLASGKKRIISFYEDIKVKVVSEEEVMRFDPEGLTFFNINTLGDLERAKIIARENGSKETTHD
jgi:molybdopterin-guanine dinucleotide biosynthesis protein A